MKSLIIIFCLLLSLPVYAQQARKQIAKPAVKALPAKKEVIDVAPTKPIAVEEPDVVQAPDEPPVVEVSHRLGRNLSLGVNGALLGLAVPFKYGVSVAWLMDEKWTFEASYFNGNFSVDYSFLDLGSFTDTVYSLQSRYYPGKSFNWILGVARQDYHVKLGSDIVAAFSGASASYDALTVHIVDIQIGFGNRWQLANGIMIGADWLILNIPVSTLKNEAPPVDAIPNASVRDQINDGLRFMRYFPTGAIAKLTLGYTF